MDDYSKYGKHYDEQSFLSKLRGIGGELAEYLVTAYYAIKDSNTPDWVKALLIGGLGYFILPLDLIPDLIPVAGFADDLGVILTIIKSVADHITENHRQKAREFLSRNF